MAEHDAQAGQVAGQQGQGRPPAATPTTPAGGLTLEGEEARLVKAMRWLKSQGAPAGVMLYVAPCPEDFDADTLKAPTEDVGCGVPLTTAWCEVPSRIVGGRARRPLVCNASHGDTVVAIVTAIAATREKLKAKGQVKA